MKFSTDLLKSTMVKNIIRAFTLLGNTPIHQDDRKIIPPRAQLWT